MNFDAVADALYRASPDDFVRLRSEQVAAARHSGDRALARQISQLRRPTRSAWLVNLVAHTAPEDLATWTGLGQALRDAQHRLDAVALRRLTGDRRMVVDRLARAAVELGAAAGYDASEAVRQEVVQTLQAALADVDLSEQVRRGRVVQAIAYGGFGPFDLGGPGPVPASEGAPEPSANDTPPSPPTAAAPGLGDAQAAARLAAQRLDRARRDAAEAADRAEQATRDADDRADEVERLRAVLAAAEQSERVARDTARAARRRAEELATQAETAEREATSTAAALDALGAGR